MNNIKRSIFILIISFCFTTYQFGQGVNAQLIIDEDNDTATLVMNSSNGAPPVGESFITLTMKFVDGAGDPITGVTVASSNYNMQTPDANGISEMNPLITSPDDWTGGDDIIVAVYNIPDGTGIADLAIQATGVGDNNEDPVMSTASGDGFDKAITALATILPIRLRTFTVSKYSKDDALLEWTSSSERNSSHFEVERSLDNESWERMTYVEAAGDSNEERQYSYIDLDLPMNRNQTVFYYRLKMVDKDGEFDYSEVRKLSYNLPNQYVEIQVYPNPVQNEILVSTLSSADDETIESVLLFDADGRLMLEREISANGINRINVADLPASSYYLHVNVGGETKIEKIIKID